MKRVVIGAMVVLLPALLFANVFQAYRYSHLERRVSELENEQLSLIEENKRAILALSVLTSPDRIGALAEGELGLERIDPANITEMQTSGGAQ